MTDADSLGEALVAAGLTVAVAESCTGGLLGATLTAVPGASAWFVGGVIAYSNDLKEALLGVPEEVLGRWGAVSEQVARLMAEAVRNRCGADLGVSITGVAGPAGEGPGKPAGLIHIAVAAADATTRHVRISGDHGRAENRARAVRAALQLCVEVLESRP